MRRKAADDDDVRAALEAAGAIRARFGAPVESEDELRWDIFAVDNLRLFVCYAEDLQSIQRVAVSVPGSR